MKIGKGMCVLLAVFLIFSTVSCNDTKGDPQITTKSETEQTSQIDAYMPKDFIVHKPDTIMHYSGIGSEFAEFSSYLEYIEDDRIQIRNTNPGTSSVSVYLIQQDKVSRVFFEGEINFRHNFISQHKSDEIIIKAPVEVGNSWQVDADTTRSITAVDLLINVNGEKYKALEITTENEHSILRDYYVKDVGLVKKVFSSKELPNEQITSELYQITHNTAYSKSFTIWYPSLDDNEYLPEERMLQLNTNDDTIDEIGSIMMLYSNENDLPALISKNTKINKIDPFYDDEIVLVDFSADFISDMNAGAYYESMILNAVAMTIGGYYQKNKVMLRIDGGTYSSGHIVFDEDDYIQIEY